MGPPPAAAHDPLYWFTARYYSTSVRYHMAPSFPANSPFPFHDRLPQAAAAWPYNNGSDRPLTYFEDNRALTGWTWTQPCDNPWAGQGMNSSSVTHAGLHFGGWDGPGSDLAVTSRCYYGDNRDRIFAAMILFDDAETWWPYAEAPLNTYLDFLSVTVHELGHGYGGWAAAAHGHFGSPFSEPPTDVLCTGSLPHTMCPSFGYGLAHWRSTEAHDRDTIAAKYP